MNKEIKDILVTARNEIIMIAYFSFLSLFFSPVVFLWVKIIKFAWNT